MDRNMNTQIDLYLTEIAIELLGNKMYDVNGKRQHKITELFKPVQAKTVTEQLENSSDILCSLGYGDNFTENSDSMTHFLEDQMDFILVDANVTDEVNKSIISFLRTYKSDQDMLLKEVSELHVKKLVEEKKIFSKLNNARQMAVNEAVTNEQKILAAKKYYDTERDQLLKSCADIQRLIKFILNDTEDNVERGELIGFIHAIRTINEHETRGKKNSYKVTKPYKK